MRDDVVELGSPAEDVVMPLEDEMVVVSPPPVISNVASMSFCPASWEHTEVKVPGPVSVPPALCGVMVSEMSPTRIVP
ncbi:hypothetical protein [Amycolatopsis sp.]|uniref:hypothetical protein n=1 Tax=Amycolatopsis sp. TaxID=37632 RepID=UPI002B6FF46B|nr:hypothetical protein [Amycolatopsis sp.]HVV08487.1 hypothetical protein [Amycolatopsis sp.]